MLQLISRICRTGEPNRPPSKVGVAVTDISTGLYAHGAIMAALLSRQKTGKGVRIDCNLFETQVWPPFIIHIVIYVNGKLAGLANIASNHLIAGKEASRHGTAHPSIAPYQVFPCKNGFIMIGAGNDKQVLIGLSLHFHSNASVMQFKALAEHILEKSELVSDPKFSTNAARVANKQELIQIITDVLMIRDREYWLNKFSGLG